MSIKEIAEHLWPCWMIGIFMLSAVWGSKHRDVLRVDLKGILKFLILMTVLTIYRAAVFKWIAPPNMIESAREMVSFLPWQVTLGVFWEDACHSLPLVLLGKVFQKAKWYKYCSLPLLVLVMASFAVGHLYQGVLAAIAISFYIPFAMKMGKKYGFGTVMICHILYDMITLLSLKWLVGAW